MDTSENLLTHEEIWDDSTLVNAWEDALNEYKKYHSIEATSENKVKVLREAEEAEMVDAPRTTNQEILEYQPSIEDGEVDDDNDDDDDDDVMEQEEGEVEAAEQQQEQGGHEQVSDIVTKIIPPPTTTTTTTVPETATAHATAERVNTAQKETHARIQSHLDAQAALNMAPPPFPMRFPGDIKGQDNEALRNLMMSWYFAGYYTGLYEGQQQVQYAQQNGGQES